MGDDLTSARRFCEAARADIDAVISGVCAQPCAAPDVLVRSLASIQSGAKIINARAIFRAAQTVVDSVMERAPIPTVQGRVLSLNKLVIQYEQGLSEIMPSAANIEALNDGDITYSDIPPPMPSADAQCRFEQARATLMPLMGLARGDERPALKSVAGFSDIEIAPVEMADMGVAEEIVFSPPSPRAGLSQPASVDFETLMPAFTSHALQAARQAQKTVSVSYSCDDIRLSASQSSALQPVLLHIADTLVTGVLEQPDIRRARGDSGAGHIALTAAQSGEQLSLSIDCPGAPLAASAFVPEVHDVRGLTLTPGENTRDGLAHIVLTLPRRAAAASMTSPLRPEEIAL